MFGFIKLNDPIENNPLAQECVEELSEVYGLLWRVSARKNYRRCYALASPEGNEDDVQSVPFVKLVLCPVDSSSYGAPDTYLQTVIAPASRAGLAPPLVKRIVLVKRKRVEVRSQ